MDKWTHLTLILLGIVLWDFSGERLVYLESLKVYSGLAYSLFSCLMGVSIGIFTHSLLSVYSICERALINDNKLGDKCKSKGGDKNNEVSKKSKSTS